MPPHAKYTEVMSVIERRIREGDYLLSSIPGERKIAEETGVSYMTARRAVLKLLDQKVLIRQTSGALDVHPAYAEQTRPAEVVLLYPAYASTYLTQLRTLVSDFADKRGVRLRPAQFVHWDESSVVETAEQARGSFVIPSGSEIPTRLIETFKENKVVILDGNFAESGLPSIRLFSEENLTQVLNHLRDVGHRKIDCLNTQNENEEIVRRIDIWRHWGQSQSITGTLWDQPAPVFTDPTIAAYKLMCKLLGQKRIEATALIATTCPAAIGMMRACWERGIEVGKDLSICSMNIEPPAEFYCPSITGLSTPKLDQVLKRCFDWIFNDSEWEGSKLMEPTQSSLFLGESTGTPV